MGYFAFRRFSILFFMIIFFHLHILAGDMDRDIDLRSEPFLDHDKQLETTHKDLKSHNNPTAEDELQKDIDRVKKRIDERQKILEKKQQEEQECTMPPLNNDPRRKYYRWRHSGGVRYILLNSHADKVEKLKFLKCS